MWRLQRRRRGGFTLVELLVVVALIALLAGLALLPLLRARVMTFERLAMTNLRTLRYSLEMYIAVRSSYPPDLTVMGVPSATPPFLSQDLIGNGITFTKQGYIFTYTPPAGSSYTVVANPISPRVTGERHFVTDNTQVVHYTTQNRDAVLTDPVAE